MVDIELNANHISDVQNKHFRSKMKTKLLLIEAKILLLFPVKQTGEQKYRNFVSFIRSYRILSVTYTNLKLRLNIKTISF